MTEADIVDLTRRQQAMLWLLSTYGGQLAIQHRQRELRLTTDTLVALGLVRQVPDSQNQFSAKYGLTDSGARLVSQIEAALADHGLRPQDAEAP